METLLTLALFWALVATAALACECSFRRAAERHEAEAWGAVCRLEAELADLEEADRVAAASLRSMADDLDPPDEG